MIVNWLDLKIQKLNSSYDFQDQMIGLLIYRNIENIYEYQRDKNVIRTPQAKKEIPEMYKSVTSVKRQQFFGMIKVKDYGFYKHNEIGTGSFSRVYRGFNVQYFIKLYLNYFSKINDQNSLVAIKEIKIQNVGEKKLMQEINIHQSMSESQYIVKLLDYFIDRNLNICYLVLEYCQQGSLEKQYRMLSKPKALQYFSQLLDAMNYLSKNNIIHRDLKLENILIKNSQIKLADFGFARSLPDNQLSVHSQKCGTPATMAPELIFNDCQKVNYSDKQDVWSLGIILHELIYKEHPFGQNKERMKQNQRVFVKCKDPLVESFLEKSLQFDSNLRMTLAECLNHPIYRPGECSPIKQQLYKITPFFNDSEEAESKNFNNKDMNKYNNSQLSLEKIDRILQYKQNRQFQFNYQIKKAKQQIGFMKDKLKIWLIPLLLVILTYILMIKRTSI